MKIHKSLVFYFFFYAASLAVPAIGSAQTEDAIFVGKSVGKEFVLRFISPEELKYRIPEFDGKTQTLAEYFERSTGKIIPLVKADDGWLMECVATFAELDCAKPTGYWKTLVADQSSDPKKLFLQRKSSWAGSSTTVEFSETRLAPLKNLTDWDQLLGTGKTSVSKVKRENGVVTAILTDERSGVKVPQAISGYSAKAIREFNARQSEVLVGQSALRLENLSLGGDEQDSLQIVYQSPRYLVWGGGQGGDYGGSHGLYAYTVETYDMKTASLSRDKNVLLRYDISELIVSETQKIRNAAKSQASKNQASEPDVCFSAWLEKLQLAEDDWDVLTAGHKKLASHIPIEESNSSYFMPQRNGIAVVSNDFSEAGRQCRGIQVVIPWKKALPYLKKAM